MLVPSLLTYKFFNVIKFGKKHKTELKIFKKITILQRYTKGDTESLNLYAVQPCNASNQKKKKPVYSAVH